MDIPSPLATCCGGTYSIAIDNNKTKLFASLSFFFFCALECHFV